MTHAPHHVGVQRHADWAALREAWWRRHRARFGATLAGLAVRIGATLRERS